MNITYHEELNQLEHAVRSVGYRKLSARPRHHAQDAEAAEAFKKIPRRCGRDRRRSRQGQSDRNLVSGRGSYRQKNKITRRWAKRGSRPSAPLDQRTRAAYIFGAICPKQGKAAALVMPWCDTHAINQHLIERCHVV
ncbi:hypothetical protein HFO27_37020 [Rhizobium leguminosarum]|nr:hypothetical protein [Rhizobium leguminosarum]